MSRKGYCGMCGCALYRGVCSGCEEKAVNQMIDSDYPNIEPNIEPECEHEWENVQRCKRCKKVATVPEGE